MPRTIGYFKYKTRSAIEIYGSGFFKEQSDNGYIYGWSETLTDFTLRCHLKTFTNDTTNAEAGIMFRTQANANMAYIGILMGGDNTIRVDKRVDTNDVTTNLASSAIGVHQGVWLQMVKVGNVITLQYSLNAESTSIGSISWTTLHTATGTTDTWSTLEKHLCCSSGGDNVNLAYFTKVYTEDCWISPIGQKED